MKHRLLLFSFALNSVFFPLFLHQTDSFLIHTMHRIFYLIAQLWMLYAFFHHCFFFFFLLCPKCIVFLRLFSFILRVIRDSFVSKSIIAYKNIYEIMRKFVVVVEISCTNLAVSTETHYKSNQKELLPEKQATKYDRRRVYYQMQLHWTK